MEKHHFEQAKIWYKAAQLTSDFNEDYNKYIVAIAMLIHGIIKANDALAYKFYRKTPKKHDEARKLFETLIREKHIKESHAVYSNTIQEAINIKARVEYKGNYVSSNDFEIMSKKAERFIKMCEEYIK